MLENGDADVGLVGTLLSLTAVIPACSRETARAVVRKVTDDLEARARQARRFAARRLPGGTTQPGVAQRRVGWRRATGVKSRSTARSSMRAS